MFLPNYNTVYLKVDEIETEDKIVDGIAIPSSMIKKDYIEATVLAVGFIESKYLVLKKDMRVLLDEHYKKAAGKEIFVDIEQILSTVTEITNA